ncbi:D-aminoacylase [Qipengyuania sp. DY56-A-20]|jgi:N-acyl-D-amino-acid deacylase|uniref:D-aminoacylase n=1 Tax=Qipengyuania benthica TaxID=3067651 RepID=A0ABT9H9M4_9SPHN|nr:D-aminoacylase [Qipengyuania sp. DY56-A-20]MDP4540019.1 D-aminoacylase [Qipengyuania sp. DY56-A-20]
MTTVKEWPCETARLSLATLLLASMTGCATAGGTADVAGYDLVIRNGSIYDGSGSEPYVGDLAVEGDQIVAIGQVRGEGREEIDAAGMAVAPGFINMLSWANRSLLEDGRGMSDIRQGVTLEVFGEGWTMGPINSSMRQELQAQMGESGVAIGWTTLGEYLENLEEKGISPNVASFVGATTVRIHELGEQDVDPNPDQLARMRALVRQAMEEGAMGVGSALIYAPGNYAETRELVALAEEAGRCGGMYISHMRLEADEIGSAIDEVITIAREAGLPAEIYHLKLAGKRNWDRLPEIVAKIEDARRSGIRLTTNMYLYTAGGTGLDAVIPPWVQAGGRDAMLERLQDPATRARILQEMRAEESDWENLLRAAGGDGVLLVNSENPEFQPLMGKTLAQIAALRGTSVEETAVDLVLQDGQIGAIYFMMSEENIAKQAALPWMSFGSDASAPAAEGETLNSAAHPRTYGNFSRLLGKYVREEEALPLARAIRGLTALPASNLGLRQRGSLAVGNFADIVIFDPTTISDHATYNAPHQYATGVTEVFINGVQVLSDGQHTGATPGRVVRGPGWTGWPGGGACAD